MVQVNRNVEYKNLKGFPSNETDEIKYLISSSDGYSYNAIDKEIFLTDLNSNDKKYNHSNSIFKLGNANIDKTTKKLNISSMEYYINNEKKVISSPLSLNLSSLKLKNILPVMATNSEQNWALFSNKENGYEFAKPFYITNDNATGFQCNVKSSSDNLTILKLTSLNSFEPYAIRLKNRSDSGSGISYQSILNYNIKNDKDNVIVSAENNYKTKLNELTEFLCLNNDATKSIKFEVSKADSNDIYTNFGRKLEILVKDNNGNDSLIWSVSYIFLNTSTNTLVEEYGNLSLSSFEPLYGQKNDLYIDYMDNNKVYKFDGLKWVLQSYILVASIVYNYQEINDYKFYTGIDNWYNETIKNNWVSPNCNIEVNSVIKYPYSSIIQNIKNKNYSVELINKVAELGYSVGDIAQGFDYTPYVDEKYIGLYVGNNIQIMEKNGVVKGNISLDKWSLIFKIY